VTKNKPDMPTPTFTVKVSMGGGTLSSLVGPTYGLANRSPKTPPSRRLRSTWRPLTRPTPTKPLADDGPSE